MDYFTFVNVCWVVVLLAAVLINFVNGYTNGVMDSHESITIPLVDHLVKHNYLNARYADDTPIDSRRLAAYLITEMKDKKG